MSVDTTIAVLYAQSGMSTNVANAAMVAPQAAVAVSRVLAAEAALQERDRVAKNSKTESLNAEADGGGGRSLFQSRLRARRKNIHAEEEAAPVTTPFVGNLLNVKV